MSSLNKNTNYYDIQILTGIIVAGMLVSLFMGQNISKSGDIGPANASIWGYGMVGGSLLCLWFTTFYLINKETINSSIWQVITKLIALSMPVILTLGSIAWLLSFNIIYKDRINKGRVSKDFTTFSGVSLFLLIIQLAITLNYLKDKIGEQSLSSKLYQILSSQLAVISYLVAVVNYTILGLMFITLEYMSTDG